MQPDRRRAVSLLVRDRCPRDDAWSRGRAHVCDHDSRRHPLDTDHGPADVLFRCWSVIGVQGMTPGVVVAYMRAAAAIWSAATPVISATRSSGNSLTRARNSSNPVVHLATKS